ncbi:MAG: class II D-tagatose-bisphosphate aldolase, non-catalytic subunit [Sedimentisphaerales bacterium]
MYLDEIVSAQKRGEAKGIPSICSAHSWVLKAALLGKGPILIESTCNQVNQFGGYTGMNPGDFVRYVSEMAAENHYPLESIILGGDHLGPNVWMNESSDKAMQKSEVMIRDYIQAGFIKIHIDCSMPLADDKESILPPEISARRTAQLAKVSEASHVEGLHLPRYIIGTEVPIPGGAQEHIPELRVTNVNDTLQNIELIRKAFVHEGLESAWERVIAVVVQPGVEFGDDFILEYNPSLGSNLSRYIDSQPQVFEVHSTDYQKRDSLKNLVRDHFAILKVGPALTFAFREAIFSLAWMEDEMYPKDKRSNLIQLIDDAMIRNPADWQKHYHGDSRQLAFARKFSLSDRIRYYWLYPQVQAALNKLFNNLNGKPLPFSLLSQFMPRQYNHIRNGEILPSPKAVILDHIQEVLQDYQFACD